MKKVLILLAFLFCAVVSFAQYPNNQSISNTLTIYHAKGALTGDSAFMLPVNDTLNNLATPYYGAVTVLPSDRLKDTIPIWMSNGHHWIRFQGSSGFNINDTIYTRLPIYVDTVSNPGKRVIAFLRENGLISGGVVTVDSCMTIDVTAPTFLINYKQYVGLATFGIAITPSNVLPRIDRVVIDTNLVITVIAGTPSATPIAPPYNSFSQISLAEIPVGAGVTCLGTQEIIYDGVADFAGQWTITESGTASTSFTNPANPYHLTQASYTVTYSNGYQIIYTKPSGTDTVKATSILKGFITLIGGLTSPNQISGQWYNGTTAVSSPLLLNAYFNPNDSNVYQMFVVPLNAWSWPGGSVFNKLVLTFGGNDNSGAKGIYLDWIQLQTGIGSPAKQYQDSSRIIGGWLTDFYNGIGIRRDSIVGGSGGSGWLLLGNAATDSALNFVGTTDNIKLNFRVNNILAGSIGTNTTYNVSLGSLSLPVTSTGVKNTAIGGGALGLNTTGFSNTSVGYTANYHNVIGNSNTAVGWASLGWNNGTGNTAIGSEAYNSTPSSVSTGTYNTAIGHQALLDNASHNYNTGIGIRAGASAAQDFTLYMSDSTKHGYWKALDSATGTAPNVLSIDPLGFIHRYAAPSGGSQTLQQTFNLEARRAELTNNDTIDVNSNGLIITGGTGLFSVLIDDIAGSGRGSGTTITPGSTSFATQDNSTSATIISAFTTLPRHLTALVQQDSLGLRSFALDIARDTFKIQSNYSTLFSMDRFGDIIMPHRGSGDYDFGGATYYAGWDIDGNFIEVPIPVAATVTQQIAFDNSVSALDDPTILLGGNVFEIEEGSNYFLLIDPTPNAEFAVLQAYNTTDNDNIADISTSTTDGSAQFAMEAVFNDNVKQTSILGQATITVSSLEYIADTHTFTGGVIMATQFTPANSTDNTYPNGALTQDDTFLYYRTSTGTWVKITWVTF